MSTYSAGKQRCLKFCNKAQIPALPATEVTLTVFVTHLATNNISHASIKVYLLAVWHMHILEGFHNEFNQLLTPCLQLILKGSEHPLGNPE